VTLTAKDVAEITRLLEGSEFDELTLELDGLKLTVRRKGAAAPSAPQSILSSTPVPRAGTPESASPGPAPPADAASAVDPVARAAAEGATHSITAPLLGTFYRAPKPGAPPFVEVGSSVEEDTIVGIIEVMKLMNTVRAATRGMVVAVLAQDGALVEYGETLMRVSRATGA
jgi:acetyl-CoA carboxylase biotin carboxyl carrier protein